MSLFRAFKVFSSAFFVRIRGQGARVRLGLCARLISFLSLLLFRRDRIVSALRFCSPCWHFLQFKSFVFVHLYEFAIILLTLVHLCVIFYLTINIRGVIYEN